MPAASALVFSGLVVVTGKGFLEIRKEVSWCFAGWQAWRHGEAAALGGRMGKRKPRLGEPEGRGMPGAALAEVLFGSLTAGNAALKCFSKEPV